MTPAQMLIPQPPPDSCAASVSVTDYVLDWLDRIPGASPVLIDLVRARREQGRERYGTELTTRNGRDPLVDAAQEAIDLVLYLAQDLIERPRGRVDVRIGRYTAALALAADLVAELEARP